MKKVLAVVLAAAFLGIGAMSADAQVPNVQVYFDDLLQQTSKDCPPGVPGTVLDVCYVVANNFGIFMIGLEYQITYPPVMAFIGDNPTNGALELGNSAAGHALTWPIPQNAFGPFVANIVDFLWLCDGCDGNTYPVVVGPNPQSGLVRGVEWQTINEVIGVGMTSLVCPGTVSNEESTWGKVKALYN